MMIISQIVIKLNKWLQWVVVKKHKISSYGWRTSNNVKETLGDIKEHTWKHKKMPQKNWTIKKIIE
jgi:hypothetical protein